MPSTLNWNAMIDRQAACKKFLTHLVANPADRDAALEDPKKARELFKEKGEIDLPDEVEIKAVDYSRPARDNYNLILVPEHDPDPDPLRYWAGAWVPYAPGQPRGGGN